MAASHSQIDARCTLASLLAERGPVAAAPALGLVRNLALQVADLHVAGMIHGAISCATVRMHDLESPRLESPRLESPRLESARLETPAADAILRLDDDWAGLLPEFSQLPPLKLPVSIEAAAQQLQAAGIALDPRQIDLCQLAALWCRVMTAQSPSAYLRSPRVKGLVPGELRPVLERSLGANGRERFADAGEFVIALQAAAEQFAPPATINGSDGGSADAEPSIEPTPARTASDTTPSFVSSTNQPSDTSIVGGPVAKGQSPAAPREDAVTHDAQKPLPLARLGHYEIVRQIGRGGMGDVYLGYEQALDRNVAIKVLPADLARSDEFVRRFRTEATAVAKLNHPNIVPIYFIGEDQGHHFYVMQFVEGESLAELLARRERLSIGEALPIVEQALAGLAAAHDRGMVHRDIKPGNILLDSSSGRALLADFGLVKSLESSATGKTATGVVMGTADYISPEQGRGQPVDARSDLYSMGVLLYRMLSGRLPFTADNPTALIFQHVYEHPPYLQEIAPEVSETMGAVVSRLLAKSPADRHQTVADLLADLRAVREGQPLPARCVSHFEQPTTIIRLSEIDEEPPPLPADLAGLAPPPWWEQMRGRALSMFRRHAPEVLQQLQNTQQQLDGAIAGYERRQRDLQQLANTAESVLGELRTQAQAQRAGAQAAADRAQAAADAVDQVRARDEAVLCLRAAEELERQIADQQEELEPIRLRLAQAQARVHELRNQRDILNARFKAAGAQARVHGGYTVRPRSQRLGLALAALACLAGVTYLIHTWTQTHRSGASADSQAANSSAEKTKPESKRELALKGDSDADMQDIPEHLRPRPRIPLRQFGPEGRVLRVAFHPQGKLLASTGEDGFIRLWNTNNWEQIKEFESGVVGYSQMFSTLVFSPDGRYIAAAVSDSRREPLKLWDWESNSDPRVLPDVSGSIAGAAFSHDGDLLAVVHTTTFKLALWNVADLTLVRHMDLEQFLTNSVAFSPVERLLACGGTLGTVQLWEPDQPKPRRALEGLSRAITTVVFSRDGALLAARDESDQVIIWDVKSGDVLDSFKLGHRQADSMAFSNDGRSLFLGGGRLARIWDREMRHFRGEFKTHRDVAALALSPDGTKVVTCGWEPSLLLWDARPEPVYRGTSACRTTAAPATMVAIAAKTGRILTASKKPKVIGYLDSGATDKFHTLAEDFGLIRTIAITDDGRYAVAGTVEGTVCLWDLMLGHETRRMNTIANVVADQSAAERELQVHSVSFAPDRRHVLVTTSQTVFLWDIRTGEEIYRFASPPAYADAAVSPDGKYAVTGGWNSLEQMGDLRLWDMKSGEYVRRFVGHVGRVESLTFSSDGRNLLTGGTASIHLWDVESGDEVRSFKAKGATSAVSFSPDGQHCASACGGIISVWNITNGDEEIRFISSDYVNVASGNMAYTADGRFIAASADKENLRLWNIQISTPKAR